jgi:hypothetical protein
MAYASSQKYTAGLIWINRDWAAMQTNPTMAKIDWIYVLSVSVLALSIVVICVVAFSV